LKQRLVLAKFKELYNLYGITILYQHTDTLLWTIDRTDGHVAQLRMVSFQVAIIFTFI